MLPKSKRLTKEDFKDSRPKIFFRGEFFDIATLPINPSKFACVIAKKTLSRAVDRNTLKRKIFAIVGNSKIKSSYSFIIYPKKTSSTIPYSQLEEEIRRAFATLD